MENSQRNLIDNLRHVPEKSGSKYYDQNESRDPLKLQGEQKKLKQQVF
jgi:hypothetical protein